MRLRARVVFAVACASVVACSLMLDDGFSGGGDNADGSISPSPCVGATCDASESETSLGSDASADDAGIADGGTEASVFSYCPSYATFCDDFESGNFNKWSGPFERSGAT